MPPRFCVILPYLTGYFFGTRHLIRSLMPLPSTNSDRGCRSTCLRQRVFLTTRKQMLCGTCLPFAAVTNNVCLGVRRRQSASGKCPRVCGHFSSRRARNVMSRAQGVQTSIPMAWRMAICTGEGGSDGSNSPFGSSGGWAMKRGSAPRCGCAEWTKKGWQR